MDTLESKISNNRDIDFEKEKEKLLSFIRNKDNVSFIKSYLSKSFTKFELLAVKANMIKKGLIRNKTFPKNVYNNDIFIAEDNAVIGIEFTESSVVKRIYKIYETYPDNVFNTREMEHRPKKYYSNEFQNNALLCSIASYSLPDMIVSMGSNVNNEASIFSDVDLNIFLELNDKENEVKKLNRVEKNFNLIAQHYFNVKAEGKNENGELFYEPHWSLFCYPKYVLEDVKEFSSFCSLPAKFTLFNIKKNTNLIFGEDLRENIPVNFNENLVDKWASFAPVYHLRQSILMIENEKDLRKACYALSKAILQTSRVVAWKEDRNYSSSYESIVKSIERIDHKCKSLSNWALNKRKSGFKTNLTELEGKIDKARNFINQTSIKYQI